MHAHAGTHACTNLFRTRPQLLRVVITWDCLNRVGKGVESLKAAFPYDEQGAQAAAAPPPCAPDVFKHSDFRKVRYLYIKERGELYDINLGMYTTVKSVVRNNWDELSTHPLDASETKVLLSDHKVIADKVWPQIESDMAFKPEVKKLHDKGFENFLEIITMKNINWVIQSNKSKGSARGMYSARVEKLKSKEAAAAATTAAATATATAAPATAPVPAAVAHAPVPAANEDDDVL